MAEYERRKKKKKRNEEQQETERLDGTEEKRANSVEREKMTEEKTTHNVISPNLIGDFTA